MDINKYLAKPDETLGEHVRRLLDEAERLREYGYIRDTRILELLFIACIHHDDGKMNRQMQKRLDDVRAGKSGRFNPEKEVVHNVLSGFLLNPDEEAFHGDKNDYYRVLFAILFHHDYGNPWEIMEDKQELIEELLQDFDTVNIKKILIQNRVKRIMTDPSAVKIKGYLHKCDYSASGHYVSEYPNNFLDLSMENVKAKWRRNNPEADWNELQKFCKQKEDENIIVVAQTGMGKTEAGFRWIGNHKGFFVLPLRTAINAIYDRVRKDTLQNKEIDTRLSILHSESLEYYTKQFDEMDLVEYENRGKHLSIPLNISTLDQLFDFVFRYQTYELKLTTLSYSKIVIDEIQMYDPELLCFLITGLKMIVEMGGKIAVMTATLSPFIKDILRENIPFEEENIRTFVDDSLRHYVEIRDRKINAEEIHELYQKNKERGNCNKILVVCNTIRKAQELYEKLKDDLAGENIHILHSRFIKADRGKLEKEILEFGKTYDDEGNLDCQSGIWISTSIVEASLDIDFDYLVTELQELNSLFQRFGRCNRKGKKSVESPNCIVYTTIDAKYLSNAGGFIDSTLFQLSKEALREGEGLLSEAKKIGLLDKYFTTEKVRRSDYYRRYHDVRKAIDEIQPYEFDKKTSQLRSILSETVIPSPVYIENRTEIEEALQKIAEAADYIERVKAREELLQYTVSVPDWYLKEYQAACTNKTAEEYPVLEIGKREKISVIQCEYDEAGYHHIKFEKTTGKGEFL